MRKRWESKDDKIIQGTSYRVTHLLVMKQRHVVSRRRLDRKQHPGICRYLVTCPYIQLMWTGLSSRCSQAVLLYR